MELSKLVEAELSKEEDSKELVSLWRQIHGWFEEGGPDAVEDNLKDFLKDAEKTVKQNIKSLPEVKTRKKAKKRKRK